MNPLRFLIFVLLLVVSLPSSYKALACSDDCCSLCESTPCQCDKLFACEKDTRSIKRLILLLLGKSNGGSGGSDGSTATAPSCHECNRCRYTVPKKSKLVKVLTDVLRKSCSPSENEEQALKNLIVKMIDPSVCEKRPCEPYCDPQVQRVLRAILKKASGCNCRACPCDCMVQETRDPANSHKEFQYWYRTTRANMRSERGCKASDDKDESGDKADHDGGKGSVPSGGTQVRTGSRKSCSSHRSRMCHTCQRPDILICPRYLADDCPAACKHYFSICADCSRCQIAQGHGHVALACSDCKPVDSPYVHFTQTGHPYRSDTCRTCDVQIRAKYLQINDFRPESVARETRPSTGCSFNPFRSQCNRPRAKRKKCKKR